MFVRNYLDSNAPTDYDKLEIPGYTLIRSEHPSNTKCDGVSTYCRSSLPLRDRNMGYLHECLGLELQISDKKICNSQVNLKTILKPLLILLK